VVLLLLFVVLLWLMVVLGVLLFGRLLDDLSLPLLWIVIFGLVLAVFFFLLHLL
jgi:hypothetical protein